MNEILAKNKFKMVKQIQYEKEGWLSTSTFFLESVTPKRVGRLINIIEREDDKSRRRIEIRGFNVKHKPMSNRHKIMCLLYDYCDKNYGVTYYDEVWCGIIGQNYLE